MDSENRNKTRAPNDIPLISSEAFPRIALRKEEAAESIGVSVRTLHNLLKSGEIEHVKLDRAVLVPVAGLHRFIESKSVRS